MKPSMLVLAFLLVCIAALPGNAQPAQPGSWELQYQHIDNEYDLTLFDMAFIDPQRGLATGMLVSRKRDRQENVNLITTDGKTWKVIKTKKACQDVHALTTGVLFAACEDGIYRSDEMGNDWDRLSKLRDIEQVWFLTEQRGFAVGRERRFYETVDGGKKWSPIATKPELNTSEDYTVLSSISFANPAIGMVTGWSRIPNRREFLPDWLTPDRALRQRDTPHVNLIIDTRDGGATWNSQQISMFGEMVTAKIAPDGMGLGLVNFSNGFEYPSEVFYFGWPNGTTQRVYREKTNSVTDVALPPMGPAYIVAVASQGQLHWSPIPGKVQVLRTTDFNRFDEMAVDYRTSARRPRFVVYDAMNIWLMTDTGMVLKLNPGFTEPPARTAPEAPAAPDPAVAKPPADAARPPEAAKPKPPNAP